MPYESLTKYHWDSTKVRPIVSFDFKVYARDVEFLIKNHIKKRGELSPKEMENYMKAIWAYKMNRGADCLSLDQSPLGFTGIVVDDYKGEMDEEIGEYGKGYWRNYVSAELGLPPYKGGRKPKDDIMLRAVDVGLEYLQKVPNFFYFAQMYFEADDLNGHMARSKRDGVAKDRGMYLSTLDGDIQVLVADEHKITWCNTRSFNDRIRGNQEVIDYYIRKEGVILNHPCEVSKLKVCVGDAGDNLSKGSPLRLFDLLEEDEEYQIDVNIKKDIDIAMDTDIQSNNPEHLEKAVNFLISKGYRIPETPNPSAQQYDYWANNAKNYRKKILDFSEMYQKNEKFFSN